MLDVDAFALCKRYLLSGLYVRADKMMKLGLELGGERFMVELPQGVETDFRRRRRRPSKSKPRREPITQSARCRQTSDR